jgi:predicted dienelactone hydrolase
MYKFKIKQLAILSLLIVSNNIYSQVGLKMAAYIDTTRDRTLETAIFYPSETNSIESYGGNRVFKGFNASLNAKVQTNKKLPLIILVHGTSGNWKNLSWLGVPLAEKGAIIAAANHKGSTTGDATPSSVIRMWQQPQDISFLISELLNSEFSDFIDKNNIIVIGSSLGGYTSLALSGAILNFEHYKQFCLENSNASTQYFLPALDELDQEFYHKANQSHFDERIKLAIALVPGFVEVFNLEVLQKVKTPALIIGASLDENLPPAVHYHPFLSAFPSAWEYFEVTGATHYSFLQNCTSDALEILAEENAEFACLEKGRKTRTEIHEEILQKIVDYIASYSSSN